MKRKEKQIRCFMVESSLGPPYFCAGSTIQELMNGLVQIAGLKDLQEGDEITISIQKFTKSEIEQMPEI